MFRRAYPWLIGLLMVVGLAVGMTVLIYYPPKEEIDRESPLPKGNDGESGAAELIQPPGGEIAVAGPTVSVPRSDEELRAKVVGTWQDEYQGKRTMTLRSDGTGDMVVELSGLKAALVAPRLTFQMEWSIAQGRLKKRSLGGEPAVQVNMILKTLGDTVEEEILEVTEDRLLLLDPDGKTQYDWRRKR
jgi:hypothetical protein